MTLFCSRVHCGPMRVLINDDNKGDNYTFSYGDNSNRDISYDDMDAFRKGIIVDAPPLEAQSGIREGCMNAKKTKKTQ